MAEKNNAKCSICGGEYYVCLSCRDSIRLNPWKTHCCSSVHYQVYQILRGFTTGVYTKDEAKERFYNVDLKDIDSFRPHIKDKIKEILDSEESIISNTKDKLDAKDVQVKLDVNLETESKLALEVEVDEESNPVIEDIELKSTYKKKKKY